MKPGLGEDVVLRSKNGFSGSLASSSVLSPRLSLGGEKRGDVTGGKRGSRGDDRGVVFVSISSPSVSSSSLTLSVSRLRFGGGNLGDLKGGNEGKENGFSGNFLWSSSLFGFLRLKLRLGGNARGNPGLLNARRGIGVVSVVVVAAMVFSLLLLVVA